MTREEYLQMYLIRALRALRNKANGGPEVVQIVKDLEADVPDALEGLTKKQTEELRGVNV